MSHYKKFQGGYAGITKNISDKKGAGKAEHKIMAVYRKWFVVAQA
jgi:hypothetical protein